MTYIGIYLGLSLAYFEAAVQSFTERNRHSAWREVVIAGLYSTATLMALVASPRLIELSV